MMQPVFAQLAESLKSPRVQTLNSSRPARGGRRAAVLALFWAAEDEQNPDGVNVVVLEKTAHVRQHAGQVAFPGGSLEGDETPVAGALREANEEVGIDARDVAVLGVLPPAAVTVSGFDVTCVAALWKRPTGLVPVDTGEVQAVHRLNVAHLRAPANRATWVHPRGVSGPAFVVGDLFVWGLTAHLMSGLLDLAGWSLPWDHQRRLAIPARFLRE